MIREIYLKSVEPEPEPDPDQCRPLLWIPWVFLYPLLFLLGIALAMMELIAEINPSVRDANLAWAAVGNQKAIADRWDFGDKTRCLFGSSGVTISRSVSSSTQTGADDDNFVSYITTNYDYSDPLVSSTFPSCASMKLGLFKFGCLLILAVNAYYLKKIVFDIFGTGEAVFAKPNQYYSYGRVFWPAFLTFSACLAMVAAFAPCYSELVDLQGSGALDFCETADNDDYYGTPNSFGVFQQPLWIITLVLMILQLTNCLVVLSHRTEFQLYGESVGGHAFFSSAFG
jgi:hypothetical protein